MFSSQTKGLLFSALYTRTCTVEGHTHHARTIPAFMETQPFSSSTDSGFSPLFSCLCAPPPPFHKTTLGSSEPRGEKEEKEQNLQEEQRGSVVLLYTGEQHPFDWEPEVRAWLPKPAGFFGVCAQVFVHLCSLNVCVGSSVCVSHGVHETLPANVTGMSQTVFLWQTEVTWQHSVWDLFIRTVNYSIWPWLVCDVLARPGGWTVWLYGDWHWEISSILSLFIPQHSISSLSSLTPVNSSSTQSLIRLNQSFPPKWPLKTGYFWSFFLFMPHNYFH